ncbi:hypothetical protein FF38_12314 [Lucilia cuprina]|uniref:Uncharacterized protein n=1 Tax=Lucilia cuprina TaxID=7375 RepID=A0A0L0C537_LUCCU|nr:hypothetical protein FF38_12314 [Lucilia cuprina]
MASNLLLLLLHLLFLLPLFMAVTLFLKLFVAVTATATTATTAAVAITAVIMRNRVILTLRILKAIRFCSPPSTTASPRMVGVGRRVTNGSTSLRETDASLQIDYRPEHEITVNNCFVEIAERLRECFNESDFDTKHSFKSLLGLLDLGFGSAPNTLTKRFSNWWLIDILSIY